MRRQLWLLLVLYWGIIICFRLIPELIKLNQHIKGVPFADFTSFGPKDGYTVKVDFQKINAWLKERSVSSLGGNQFRVVFENRDCEIPFISFFTFSSFTGLTDISVLVRSSKITSESNQRVTTLIYHELSHWVDVQRSFSQGWIIIIASSFFNHSISLFVVPLLFTLIVWRRYPKDKIFNPVDFLNLLLLLAFAGYVAYRTIDPTELRARYTEEIAVRNQWPILAYQEHVSGYNYGGSASLEPVVKTAVQLFYLNHPVTEIVSKILSESLTYSFILFLGQAFLFSVVKLRDQAKSAAVRGFIICLAMFMAIPAIESLYGVLGKSDLERREKDRILQQQKRDDEDIEAKRRRFPIQPSISLADRVPIGCDRYRAWLRIGFEKEPDFDPAGSATVLLKGGRFVSSYPPRQLRGGYHARQQGVSELIFSLQNLPRFGSYASDHWYFLVELSARPIDINIQIRLTSPKNNELSKLFQWRFVKRNPGYVFEESTIQPAQ